MRRLRDLLTMLALCTLVGVSVAASVQAIRTGLPSPAEDRHEELLRALTAGRVNELPAEHQRVLLRQLENELRGGVDWQQTLDEIHPRKQRLVADNIGDLASLWMNEKMDEYFSLPNEYEKERYLDEEIGRVLRWKTTQSLRMAAASDDDPAQRQLATRILKRVTAGATEGEHFGARIFQLTRQTMFLSAIQQRWKTIASRNAFSAGQPRED